jgi:2-amino-4-hydroxy-6-hydroxymethyldihydropteridine diphosphokinase
VTDRARRAYLGIGSNLGDRLANLQSALDGLAAADGMAVTGVSSVYETEPVGGPEQPEYLNAVVAADTALDPWQLLAIAQDLETRANRVRAERWGPRTLDVDVLIVGDEVVDEPDLQVPHPRMTERGFVMAPLRDLDPGLAPEREWTGVRRTDLSLDLP